MIFVLRKLEDKYEPLRTMMAKAQQVVLYNVIICSK